MKATRSGRTSSRTARALCAVLLLSTGPAAALAGIRFAHVTVEDGLSQASVQAILQDRDGYIWLGTQEGLNRYDGYEFVTYTHSDADPASLSNNWIWALHEGADGDLWIGTDGGGLERLNTRTGAIRHFRHDPADRRTIGSDVVRDIAADAAGYLWIGTDGGGLTRIDPRDGSAMRLGDFTPHALLTNDHVRVLHRDGAGTIWIGTDGGGIERLDPATGAVTRVALADRRGTDDRVRSIMSIGTTLWIGTYEGGLIRLDTGSGAVRRFTHAAADRDSLSGNSVRALFTDDEGQLWIGTDGDGLDLFVSDAAGFRHFRHQPTDPASLGDDHVISICQDRGRVMWVGTYIGASRWNPVVGAFQTVRRVRGDAGEISNDHVLSLAESNDGSLWVGTYGGGLNRWRPARDGFDTWRHDPNDPHSLGDDRVFALAPTPMALWIGTRGAGLHRLDFATGRFRRFANDPARADSLAADGVTSLLVDRRGRLWIGTYLGGLDRLDDPTRGRFVHYRNVPGNPDSLCSDRVLALLEDDDGRIWVGTHGGGLCRLDESNGRFVAFRHNSKDTRSLSSDKVWSLHEDAQGNFWIGTQDGGLDLWRAAPRRAGRAEFGHPGLGPDAARLSVYAALTDAAGRVWFSTNRGLGELDPGSGRVRRYDVSDGLQSNEFNQGAALRTRAGELVFGGVAGFNVFDPRAIRLNLHAPQVVLTRLTRLGETVNAAEALVRDGTLEFGHRDVLLAFEWAGLDFTAPARNEYMHRLVGFDADWVKDGAVRRATYTNLAPGAYRFQVKAANNDDVWSEQPLSIAFRMRPAPWATSWARAGYALATLGMLALVYRSWVRRIAIARQIEATNAALRVEISERLAQQRALVRAKEEAQLYLDVVEAIILSLDGDGTIRLVNQKGERVLGYAAADLVGRNFYEVLVPAATRDSVRQQFANVAEYAYSESPVVARDGTERLVAWHSTALRATEDRPRGLLISGMDVTQVRSLEHQVREAQKMEALGTLARGVAHDFNNILSAILGFAELSRTEVPARSKVANYLERLELSVQRARDLVKAILTFSRQTRREDSPTRVQSVVRECLQLLRPTLPANIEIRADLDEASLAVMADPSQIHQLVMNLATNAYQSIGPGGGTISLHVGPFEVGAEFARSHPNLRTGPHVRLVVADTGRGMDEATMARMFEPFFTTKGPGQGTGLGLSVVHGIVTQMGGAIEVASSVGVGTRVSVLLPGRASLAESASTRVDDGRPLPRGTETIMFVDDEPTIVSIAREMLTGLGYRLITAADALQAQKELGRSGAEVDLVVTDQTMPNMLGIELAQAIKALYPNLPIILMSGARDDQIDDPAVAAFLSKPFTLEELARTVRTTIDRRLKLRA